MEKQTDLIMTKPIDTLWLIYEECVSRFNDRKDNDM